jgi:hypothetical protein
LRFHETIYPGTDLERDEGHDPTGTFGVHQTAGAEEPFFGQYPAWRRYDSEGGKLKTRYFFLAFVSGKLANPAFLAKAAEAVVRKEQERARELGEKRAALEAARKRLAALNAGG